MFFKHIYSSEVMLHSVKLGKPSIFYLKICLIITALSTIFPEGSFTGSDINVHKMASRNSSGALKKKTSDNLKREMVPLSCHNTLNISILKLKLPFLGLIRLCSDYLTSGRNSSISFCSLTITCIFLSNFSNFFMTSADVPICL